MSKGLKTMVKHYLTLIDDNKEVLKAIDNDDFDALKPIIENKARELIGRVELLNQSHSTGSK